MKNGQEFAGSRDRVRNYCRLYIRVHATYMHTYIHIIVTFPRWSSMSPKGKGCSICKLICGMLPLATHCHTHYLLYPFHFVLFKFEDLVAKQHPTSIHTYIHVHTFPRWSRIRPMLPLAQTVIPFINFTHFLVNHLVAKQQSTNMHTYANMLVHAC